MKRKTVMTVTNEEIIKKFINSVSENPYLKAQLCRYALLAATVIISGLLMSFAVYFYNRSQGVKEKTYVYELIFLFGIIGVIGYAVRRKKAPPIKAESIAPPHSKKYKLCFVLCIVLYIICNAVSIVINSALMQ